MSTPQGILMVCRYALEARWESYIEPSAGQGGLVA